jgi:hypothetical protein
MATELKAAGEKSVIAEIVYSGEKLILPEGMSIPDAQDLLAKRQKYLETKVSFREAFDVFPWDGAAALEAVLDDKFGWAHATATPGFWGPTPPQLITIDVGFDKKKQVPWGSFSLPRVSGLLKTSFQVVANRYVFELVAEVLRKDEATVRDVFVRVRNYLKQHSIYRGKAIKLRFLDDNGKPLEMPEPKFLATGHLREEHLIYSHHVQESIKVNLLTPIERVADCVANGIPVKRGVLLGGVFGTGKTLAATVAAHVATDHGVTYIYCPRADELHLAIEFAKQYQSPACVVFCEDVDRVMSGERSVEMDDVLNIIDGIDTKSANIITVLTTNSMERINAAMLRPGRLDAVIEITPPDAEAVQRMLRMYGGANIDEATDLGAVGAELAGNIPAVIMETVKRAKLSQLRLQPPGERVKSLSEAALLEAARTMRAQIKLLNDASAPKSVPMTVDSQLRVLMEGLVTPVTNQLGTLKVDIDALKERLDI